MPYPGYNKNKRGTTQAQPQQPVAAPTVGRTENFVTNHVKLITFICCMAVLFAIGFGYAFWRDWRYRDTPPDNLMTVAEMETIVEKGPRLTWSSFEGFGYEVIMEDKVYICRFDVEDSNYYLLVSADSKGSRLTSVLLVDDEGVLEDREIYAGN